MLKRLTLLIAIILSSIAVNAQNFVWGQKVGSSNFDIGSDIATDANGNSIVVGTFYTSTVIDTITLNSNGGGDAFVAKLNVSGEVIWAMNIGGTSTDDGKSVAVDTATGDVYVMGSYYASFTFAGTTLPYTSFGYDVFVAKISSAGVPQWIVGYTGINSQLGADLTVDPYGNIYTFGAFDSTVTIGSTSLSAGGSFETDLFLAKLTPSGSVTWATSYDATDVVYSGFGTKFGGIKCLSNGDVVFTTNFRTSITIGSTTLSSSGTGFDYDVVLARIDSSGTPVWAEKAGSSGSDYGNDLAVDANDNIWITGRSGGAITFDTISLAASGSSSVFLAKYNSSGSALYAYQSGGGSFNDGNGVDVDALGNVYVIGRYYSAITFGSIILSSTNFGSKLFVAKYDDNNSQWDWAIGPDYTGSFSPAEEGKAVAVDGEDNVFITGIFSGTIKFSNQILVTSGSYDVFIAKIGDCSTLSSGININGDTNLCAGETVELFADTSSVYDYQWVFNGASLPGQINYNYIANQAGTYVVVTDSLGCKDTSSVVTVSVGSSPTVTHSSLPSLCENDSPIVLTGGSPTGGTYSGPGVTGGVFNPSVAGPGTHPIIYTYSNSVGCADSVTKYISVTAAPFVFMLPQADVCEDDAPFALSVGIPGGGVYSGPGVVGGIIFNPAIAGIGTHTIYYTRTNGTCSTTDSVTFDVNGVPNVSLGSLSDVCISTSFTPLTGGSPFGGTYSGPGVSSPFFFPTAAGAGVHQIIYTVTVDGCSSSDTSSIQVDTVPNPIMAPLPVMCANDDTLDLFPYAFPPGGVFSGPAVVGTQFNPQVFGAGVDSIVYTITNACGSDTAARQVTVLASPTVSLGAFTDVCIDAGLQPLSGGTPIGGTYAGTGVSGGTFNPFIAGVGTHTIKYTYTNLNGCADSAFSSITVNPLPIVTLSAFSGVCIDGGTQTLSGGSPSGGTYFGTGVSTGSFDPTTAGVGTHSIGYTYTDGNGCSDTAYQNITVNPLPTVTLSAFSDVCVDAGSQTLSGGLPTGGTYFGTGVSSGSFDPATAGVGTHSIGYAYSDVNGCSDTAYQNITVNPLPTVSLSAFSALCVDAGSFTLSGGSPLGGTYFGTGVSSGVFNPATAGAGTHSIGYAYSDVNGCADTAYQNIVVNPLPTVTLSSFSGVCIDAGSQILSGGLPTGGTYFGTGVSSGSFDPTTAGVGTHSIGYAYSDVNGCADTAYQNITVNPLPTVTLSAFSDVCVDAGSQTLSGGLPTGGTYFGTGVSSGSFDPATAGVGTHSIGYAYSDVNGCSDTAYQNITVNPLPTVSLSAFSALCVDAGSFTLSGGSPSGGTYFGTGVSLGVFDPATAGAGTHSIGYAYSDVNGCVDTAYQNIVVNPLPTVTLSAFSGVCIDAGSQILSGGLPTGGTYFGTGVSSGSFDPTTAGVGTHSIGYAYSDVNGCSDTAYQNITVNPLPTVTLSAFSDVCVDAGNQTLSGGLPTGGTYFGTGVSSGSFDPATAGVGTHSIGYAYSDVNGCSDTAYQNITVNPLPTVSLSAFSALCVDAGSFTLSGGSPSGGTYFGTGVSSGVFNPATAGAGTHSIGYAYSDVNGCADTAYQNIVVNPLPTVTLSAFSGLCIDAGTQLLSGGLPTGGTYFGTGVSSGSFDPSTAGVGTHSIGYAYSDVNGCSDTAYQNITVNPLPTVTLLAISDVCVDAGNQTLNGGLPTGGTYFGTGVSSGSFDPATAGVGTHSIGYAYSDVNGCSDTAYQNITVNPLPTVTFSALGYVCADLPAFALTGGNPVGGVYFGSGVSAGNFDPSVAGVGIHTIGYTFSDLNGCRDTAYQSIEVKPLPDVALDVLDTICNNASSVVLSGGLPSGGVYFGQGVGGTGFNPSAVDTGYAVVGYTFSSSFGCADTAYDSIRIDSAPIVSLPLLTPICADTPFIVLPQGNPVGGLYSSATPNLIYGDTFRVDTSGVGSFNVTYTFMDGNGCSASNTKTQKVNPLPMTSFNLAIDSVCEYTPVGLNGESPVGGVFSGPGVVGDTVFTDDLAYGQNIIYTYTDSNGCTASSSEVLWVYPDPGIQFTMDTLVLCEGDSVSVSFADPIGGVFESDFVNESVGYIIAPDTNYIGIGGVYSFGNVCGFDKDTFYLDIQSNPNPYLGVDTFFCNRDSLELNPGDFYNYLWNNGSTNGTYVVNGIDSPATGNQVISVRVANERGCFAHDTIQVYVEAQPYFSLGEDFSACIDSVLYLTVDNVYESFTWSTGEFGNSILAHDGTNFIPRDSLFVVTGTNPKGCSHTESVNVEFLDCDSVYADTTRKPLSGVIIYPNPTNDAFFVKVNRAEITRISVIDMLGNLVSDQTVEVAYDDKIIAVTSKVLASGSYIIRLETPTEVRMIIGVVN